MLPFPLGWTFGFETDVKNCLTVLIQLTVSQLLISGTFQGILLASD